MHFPTEAKYILDWSPACGWHYTDYLLEKKFEMSLSYAVPETLLLRIGSPERIGQLGYVENAAAKREGLTVYTRDVSGIEQSVQMGAAEIASSLRWYFTQIAIGMERMNDSLSELKETLHHAASAWAYEQFASARSEYNQGLYGDALHHVSLALEGSGYHLGNPSEYRFHYLLGRIRIGSWFGPHKNAARDTVDAAKAEVAFLDAAKYRKSNRGAGYQDNSSTAVSTDVAHMLLWAGRAAYIYGDVSRAIGTTSQAIGQLSPATPGLYPAACYQYAKYLCTRGSPEDLKVAEEMLDKALSEDNTLIIEAASDPQFLAPKDFLEKYLAATQDARKARFAEMEAVYDKLLKNVSEYSYADIPASRLLRDELSTLKQTYQTAKKNVESGGLLDLDEACAQAQEALPERGYLFGLYRSRFNQDLLREWENLEVTRAARESGNVYKRCKEAYKDAEKIYRANGGFNRSGGGDKFGYGIIFTLLSVYMFFAQARWGGNTVVVALVFLAAALWLYWGFIRIKFGIVEGYERYRSTLKALQSAKYDVDHKDEVAAKAWLSYQRTIDSLGNIKTPF